MSILFSKLVFPISHGVENVMDKKQSRTIFLFQFKPSCQKTAGDINEAFGPGNCANEQVPRNDGLKNFEAVTRALKTMSAEMLQIPERW